MANDNSVSIKASALAAKLLDLIKDNGDLDVIMHMHRSIDAIDYVTTKSLGDIKHKIDGIDTSQWTDDDLKRRFIVIADCVI